MLFTQLLPNELLDVAAHVLVARRQWTGVRTEQIGSQIGKRGLMHGIARDELSWNSPTARGRCLTSSHVLEKASLGSLKTGAISPACGRTRASKLAASAVLGGPRWYHERYQLPVYVTENGMRARAGESALDPCHQTRKDRV